MLFSELAATSAAVGATRSRKRKAELLGAALRQLGPGEIEPGVAFLSGELRQRRTGVGWATLRELPPPAPAPELGVAEVDAAFARIAALAGAGSQAARREAVTALFARATAPEQAFLRGLVAGDLRQGALAGVMADAVAAATGIPRTRWTGRPCSAATSGGGRGGAARGRGRARALPAPGRPAAEPDARVAGAPRWARPWRRWGRGPWTGSSTAPASRSTATATTWRSSRRRWTT